MIHTPQKPKKLSRRFFIIAGKLLTGKNMADLGQNRHFFSRNNNPEYGTMKL